MIMLPAESLSREQNHAGRLSSKLLIMYKSLGTKQETQTVSADTKYDGQSQLEGKIGGIVYTL